MAEDNSELSASLIGTDVDVGARHVGETYARALLAAAEEKGQVEELLEELDSFIAAVTPFPKLLDVIGSGMIPLEDRVALADRVCAGRASPMFRDFLRVVTRHGRGRFLRAIQIAAHELHEQAQGKMRVEVTTAEPLDGTARQQLAARLGELMKTKVTLLPRVDARLIGGIQVRVGDTVYDGSIATRLEKIRVQMINRNIHEIQSRRDRFSSPS